MAEMVEVTPARVRNGGLPWSEDATWTLVTAWGSKFLELNRGNLKQTDWQFVAESVNAVHAFNARTARTDIQCRNRIDTVKKRFKIEKYKALETAGVGFVPTWPFFRKMDELVGTIVAAKRVTPVVTGVVDDVPMGIPVNNTPVQLPMERAGSTVAPTSASVEVAVPSVDEDSCLRRNYSTAAAAAAAEGEDGDNAEDSDSSDEETEEESDGDGLEELARLARSIKKLGKMYERVERERHRLKMELEKQRIKFAKEMKIQKMQLLMDTKIQLQKIKRARRSRSQW